MREIYLFKAITATRINSRQHTMFCPWALPREVAAHSLTRFRRSHCLHRSTVEPGVRRFNWLRGSLPSFKIATASRTGLLLAWKRYVGILTIQRLESAGWDKEHSRLPQAPAELFELSLFAQTGLHIASGSYDSRKTDTVNSLIGPKGIGVSHARNEICNRQYPRIVVHAFTR